MLTGMHGPTLAGTDSSVEASPIRQHIKQSPTIEPMAVAPAVSQLLLQGSVAPWS